MSLSTEAIVGIVGVGIALPATLVLAARIYRGTIQPRLPTNVVSAFNALLRRVNPPWAMFDNEAEVQAERLLENGSLEVGQTEGAPGAGFHRSQRFEALCREVIIREYTARQSSSWSSRDED